MSLRTKHSSTAFVDEHGQVERQLAVRAHGITRVPSAARPGPDLPGLILTGFLTRVTSTFSRPSVRSIRMSQETRSLKHAPRGNITVGLVLLSLSGSAHVRKRIVLLTRDTFEPLKLHRRASRQSHLMHMPDILRHVFILHMLRRKYEASCDLFWLRSTVGEKSADGISVAFQ